MNKNTKITWHTEKRKASDLKGYQHNPRQMTEKDFEDLKKSIKKFNYVEIVAINTDNMIIAGHQRVKALIELGRGNEQIEVRIPNRKLLKKEFQEYLIRSNKNTGEWDFDKLAEHFTLDNLEEWGFEPEELDFADNIQVQEDDFDAAKEYQKIKKARTQPGDLYIMNGHKLFCGDATDETAYKKLVNNKKPKLIFTDPPYNVDYRSPGGNTYDSKRYGGTGGKIFNDNKTTDECIEFYSKSLQNLYKYTADNVSLYWWFANRNFSINELAFKNAEWHLSQVIIWVKENFVFSRGQDYHRCYEPVMFGWKKKKRHFNNKKIGNSKDVFNLDFENFQEMFDIWYEKRDNTSKYIHPTQKPVRLSERALKKNSCVKDYVIDVFAGSGSLLIACEQLRRRAFLMELDPKYCDVIIKRYALFCENVKKKFSLIKNGKSLDYNKFL